jgi:hypothetical protein
MDEHDSLASHALNNMTLNELANTYADLVLKLRTAKEALEFYADGANYAGKCDDYQDPNCPIWSETDNDRGTRARAALEKL